MKEVVVAIIAGCILALIVIYALDKKIEKECASRDAPYSWCAKYWDFVDNDNNNNKE